MKIPRGAIAGSWALIFSLALAACKKNEPIDEAKTAGKTTADLPQITADMFKPMDGGIDLSPAEIMGRNTWNLWSGGNQHFWNQTAQDSFGLMDLLKMLDNRKFPRSERFKTLGLVNEPGFRTAGKPDEFGLWLDEQVQPEPEGIDQAVYGEPSSVLGFRLFPNTEFNDEARKKWDGDRFMNDPTYYNDNRLVRPYRVGVACGSCHISPNPSNPPADPENPRWENLASAIGNQYINEGKVFACNVQKGGFFYEMLAAQPRGTSDTSRIATDHINNPNAINAIFLLAERERIAATEKVAGGALALPGEKEDMSPVPHILKDGADSVGVLGAAIRVYVNIGMFSEYWLTRHDRLLGRAPQKPFEIPYAREHSVFWRATEERLLTIDAFFRRLKPFHLANAKAGQIWDNFSSLTYKQLSPVDELEFFNPFDQTHPIKFKAKEKNVGPGYYRTPSLCSVWSSAPLLHTNMLGKFTGDPSVAGRMDAFNDAVEKLLWPERRLNKDSIWRTQNDCSLHLRKEFVPRELHAIRALADNDGYIRVGMIPKGTPVNLVANLDPDSQHKVVFVKAAEKLIKLKTTKLSRDEAAAEFNQLIPDLLAANKCPDFIEDKGHYFGTDLPDTDKRALIEYLKTF